MTPGMLERLISFLGGLPERPLSGGAEADDPRVAAAVLLLMIADADGVRVEEERTVLRQALADSYGLGPAKVEGIVRSAEAVRNEAIDIFSFTSVLNRELDEDGKVEFVGLLWEMVYADGDLHEIEDNLVWRIAELIGVPSRERLRMRRRVREASGIGDA